MNIDEIEWILIATYSHGLVGAAVDRESHKSNADEQVRHLIAIRSKNKVCRSIQEDVVFDGLCDVRRSH